MSEILKAAEKLEADRGARLKSESAQKAAKFQKIAAGAQEVADLANHPHVKDFFEKSEARYIQEMVNAAPHDDDARRGAACMLKAVRELRALMTTGEKVAETAQKQYARLANETDQG